MFKSIFGVSVVLAAGLFFALSVQVAQGQEEVSEADIRALPGYKSYSTLGSFTERLREDPALFSALQGNEALAERILGSTMAQRQVLSKIESSGDVQQALSGFDGDSSISFGRSSGSQSADRQEKRRATTKKTDTRQRRGSSVSNGNNNLAAQRAIEKAQREREAANRRTEDIMAQAREMLDREQSAEELALQQKEIIASNEAVAAVMAELADQPEALQAFLSDGALVQKVMDKEVSLSQALSELDVKVDGDIVAEADEVIASNNDVLSPENLPPRLEAINTILSDFPEAQRAFREDEALVRRVADGDITISQGLAAVGVDPTGFSPHLLDGIPNRLHQNEAVSAVLAELSDQPEALQTFISDADLLQKVSDEEVSLSQALSELEVGVNDGTVTEDDGPITSNNTPFDVPSPETLSPRLQAINTILSDSPEAQQAFFEDEALVRRVEDGEITVSQGLIAVGVDPTGFSPHLLDGIPNRLHQNESVAAVLAEISDQPEALQTFLSDADLLQKVSDEEVSLPQALSELGVQERRGLSYRGRGSSRREACVMNWADQRTPKTMPHGSSIRAFKDHSVPAGQSCNGQKRTCNDGTLSGKFRFKNCAPAGLGNSGTQCTQQVPSECSCGGKYIPADGSCVAKCAPCDDDGNAITEGPWSIGSWSRCSRGCGGGRQFREITCKFETCTGNKPPRSQQCNTQDCCVSWEGTRCKIGSPTVSATGRANLGGDACGGAKSACSEQLKQQCTGTLINVKHTKFPDCSKGAGPWVDNCSATCNQTGTVQCDGSCK